VRDRPFSVTFIALAVLSLAAANLVRLTQAMQQAELMRSLGLAAPQAALALTGAFWTIGFGLAAIGLYRMRRTARVWTLAAIVLYQANLWLIRFAFDKASAEPMTRPADAAITLLTILLVWAYLLFWPSVRRAFRRSSHPQ